MNQEEFQQYRIRALDDYTKDKITSRNWSEDEAINQFRMEFNQMLPKGEKTESQYLFSIFHDQHIVGMIWIGRQSPTNIDEGYLYDFIIFDQYQGLGYGTKAMEKIEMIAKELGMRKISLHVFGHNKPARGVYEKLGYEVANMSMVKLI